MRISYRVGLPISNRRYCSNLPCNSYLWELCFRVESGDSVTVQMPADFVITEIELANEAHLTSYEGIGLADPGGSGGPVPVHEYQLDANTVQVYGSIVPTRRGKFFSLHYGLRGNQIYGWFATDVEQRNIVAFLEAFHSCQRGEPNWSSVICRDGQIFAEAAETISAMESGTSN